MQKTQICFISYLRIVTALVSLHTDLLISSFQSHVSYLLFTTCFLSFCFNGCRFSTSPCCHILTSFCTFAVFPFRVGCNRIQCKCLKHLKRTEPLQVLLLSPYKWKSLLKKKGPSVVFDKKTVKMQDFRCLADIIQSTTSPKNYCYILISINQNKQGPSNNFITINIYFFKLKHIFQCLKTHEALLKVVKTSVNLGRRYGDLARQRPPTTFKISFPFDPKLFSSLLAQYRSGYPIRSPPSCL